MADTTRLSFRIAKPNDALVLADILTKATTYKLNHGDHAWGEEPFTSDEVMLRINAGATYVVILGNEVVGTLALQWEDERMWGKQPQDAGYIHGLAISDGYHGQGLGTEILDWAANEVIKRGRTYLRLDCPASNTQLCNYYESHGFKHVSVQALKGAEYASAYYERPCP